MTVKKLFEMALDLLGERKRDGSFSDNSEYLSARCVTLVNQVLAELAPAQAKLSGQSLEIATVTDEDNNVTLDDRLLYTAAPAGIASLITLGEDDDRYSAYRLLFENAVSAALRSVKATASGITDVYSVEGA